MRSAGGRQRGGALIVVLIVLVLMAALSLEVAATASTHGRLADEGMNDFLLRTSVEGRREILRSAILYAKKSSQSVTREDMDWAWYNHDLLGRWSDTGGAGAFSYKESEGATAYTNTGVELLAWAEDERSKVCLLGLVPPGNEEKNSVHDRTRQVLIRLIDVYREAWSDLDVSESEAEEMVDDLITYLHKSADDEDESPLPNTPEKLGRLQCLDDLLRVPGGHWTMERLYDVKDPNWQDEEEVRRADPGDEPEQASEGTEDERFFRQNGPPGLIRFLTVNAQGGDDPQIRINFNTAPYTVLRALFEAQDENLAQAIIDHRREGVGDGNADANADSSEQTGYFQGAADLAKVDGIEDNWQTQYPVAASFFDVDSRMFSIYVIGKTVKQSEDDAPVDDQVVQDALATYQYHEIVEYVTGGAAGAGAGAGAGGQGGSGSLQTRFVERRRDPFFNRN